MDVTVIICTYNRCQTLADALASVAGSVLPDSVQWEVLVVDNNSTDRTREIVEDFSRQCPGRFRYLLETCQGKSFALNSGIREARGKVVAFMDDDVTVEPDWLHNLTASLLRGGWAGTGGRTKPAQPYSLPRWVSITGPCELGSVVAALFDKGDEPCELHKAPYGTNMAFLKSMFEKHGGFALDLGPRPGSQIRGEDTEFGRRLLAAGERLRYEPSAIVYHPVLEGRTKKEYLLDWWFDYGRGLMREKIWKPDVLGIPRQYLCIVKTVASQLSRRIGRWLFSFGPAERFYWKCQAWSVVGELAESYHLAAELKQPKASREMETGYARVLRARGPIQANPNGPKAA